ARSGLKHRSARGAHLPEERGPLAHRFRVGESLTRRERENVSIGRHPGLDREFQLCRLQTQTVRNGRRTDGIRERCEPAAPPADRPRQSRKICRHVTCPKRRKRRAALALFWRTKTRCCRKTVCGGGKVQWRSRRLQTLNHAASRCGA